MLLVDVDAGRGQGLGDLRKERPDVIGRMVALDLPEVIAGRRVADGVENMPFSFFQPLSVQGGLPSLRFHKSSMPCLPIQSMVLASTAKPFKLRY